MDDFCTQDLFTCERCKKQTPGYDSELLVLFEHKLDKNWQDGIVVMVCPECKKILQSDKKEDKAFTSYMFNKRPEIIWQVCCSGTTGPTIRRKTNRQELKND